MSIQEKIRQFVVRRAAVQATAVLLACNQACLPSDRHDLNEREDKAVQDMIKYGPDFMMPIIEDLCEVADEDKIFGLDGQTGSEACVEGAWKAFDNFVSVAEAGKIYTFYDSGETSGAAVYGLGQIGVNKYFNNFCALGDTEGCPKIPDGRTVIADFGTMLHEAAHEWSSHSSELDGRDEDSEIHTMSEAEKYQTVSEQKDFPYLLSAIGHGPHHLIDNHLLLLNMWRETEQACANGEITAQEIYDSFRDNAFDDEYWAKQIDESWGGDRNAFLFEMFSRSESVFFSDEIFLGLGISDEVLTEVLKKNARDRFEEFGLPFIEGYYEFVETHETEIVREDETTNEATAETEEGGEEKKFDEFGEGRGFRMR